MRLNRLWAWLVMGLGLLTAGCGGFAARRMAQAPNTYPDWFAPTAPVELGFSSFFWTNFPARFVTVGPPQARLRYRVVEPADYHSRFSSSNHLVNGKSQFVFSCRASYPGTTNQWSSAPRGTVVLLHGYGVGMFAMAPWALELAEDGWRCVLVDLRGHGKSTGRRIYYGVREAEDMRQLLDQLARDGRLAGPVAALGESYGAALALRWKGVDPRVQTVVAIAPYGVLSNAVLNIAHEYAGWMPQWFLKAGLKKLPGVLNVPPDQLDMTSVLARRPEAALFVAAGEDKIIPPPEVKRLAALAGKKSDFMEVPHASHEAVTYYFKELAPPVLRWLDGDIPPSPATREVLNAKPLLHSE